MAGEDAMSNVISRRELLKRAGLAGAAAVVPVGARDAAARSIGGDAVQTAAAREPLEHLTAAESAVLEAIVARLIPSDAAGPGAKEARAARYIDRALGGALSSSRQSYAAGLAALDQYARTSRGHGFAQLLPEDQDALLSEVEAGTATGFAGGSAAFFTLVRAHTIEGTFSDPYYGGNANFVGWDLIGYPGVRTIVTADDQRLGADLPPNHKSAYDSDMFNRASSTTPHPMEMARGD
jgi:gluconate 2-dehydrogenase gamma chain